jgi:hypothetical protein
METVTIQAYTFDELDEDAQTKALDLMRDINVDFEWWDFDGLLELSSDEMRQRRIGDYDYPMLSFDKFWFSIDRDWHIEFVNLDIADDGTFRKFLRIPKRLWDNLSFTFTAYGWRNKTTTIEFEPDFWGDINCGRDFTEYERSILDRAKEIFDGKVAEALRILESSYYYLLSDESVWL